MPKHGIKMLLYIMLLILIQNIYLVKYLSIYFIATKDFILDTKNDFFDSFYNEQFQITKGQIVSRVITKHIDIDLSSTKSSFKFLSVNKNPEIDDDFQIKLE